MGKPRKVSKMSPKQRAAAMISIREQQGNRSQRARTMDARQTANRLYDEDSKSLQPWMNYPGRCDVVGVDDRQGVVKEPKPKKSTKKQVYRYAMYNRPVWAGLSLSQPYTIDTVLTDPAITENRAYYNRDAHSILVTNKPLTDDELKNMELVDIVSDNKQRAHKAELISYIDTLDLPDTGKKALVGLVESGTRINKKSDVDVYARKYMAQGTRSEKQKEKKRFKADPNLLDHDLAMRAHSGTSWTPDVRGAGEIAGFVQSVEGTHEELMKSAKNDEERAIINAEMERFQAGYAQKWNAQMAAHSRCISSMITGASRFPTRSAENANNSYDMRVTETNEYHSKAVKAINRKLKAHRIDVAGGESELMKQELTKAEAYQERMKAINKILRSKKITDDVKMLRMRDEFGLSEPTVHKLMNPDYGKPGFESWQLSNNNANIKRMKERIIDMQKREATPTTEISFAGGTITDNNEADRVQIFYDEKPDPEIIQSLRGSGWRWAPSIEAWQRKRTNAAMYSAKQITGTRS